MKYIKYFLAVFALILSVSASGQISVTGTAYTEIVPLVSVREKVQMNLGRFSAENGTGSLVITPEGVRIAKGSVVLLNGFTSQAVFVVSGSLSNSISVLLPSTPQPLIHNSGSEKMYLENWTYDIPRADDDKVMVNIGATLMIGPDQINPPGIYSGTYQVVFVFN